MWLLYKGKRARSVEVEGGDAIVLKPNSKIEVKFRSKEVMNLISIGLLSPTSADPKGSSPMERGVTPVKKANEKRGALAASFKTNKRA